MSALEIILPYPPAGTTGNHAVKHARGGHYLTTATKRYRYAVMMCCATQRARRQLAGPLLVEWAFNPPDRRARDSDNVLKTLKDAMTAAGVWIDDSNKVIRRESIEWLEPLTDGRVVVHIRAMSDEKNTPEGE